MGKLRHKMWQKFNESLTSFDTFGTNISFEIKGTSTYNSVGGALLTLFIHGVVLFYAQNKFIKMSDRLDTNFQ